MNQEKDVQENLIGLLQEMERFGYHQKLYKSTVVSNVEWHLSLEETRITA